MLKTLFDSSTWLPGYLLRSIKRGLFGGGGRRPAHLFFCICDHFEPYWSGADPTTARGRIKRWIKEYPKIAARFPDSDGMILKYSFFYPEEEYTFEDMQPLAELCRAGFGEVEIHLHHDNDTSQNLRRVLTGYKSTLYERHGLLSVDTESGAVSYGFIHGNWALDNSRSDRRWCGVNDELTVLRQTGCYADFTMPSALFGTQTRKINSIYRAVDDPLKPKSHNSGNDVASGKRGEGLLMIQGPLCFNWGQKKYYVLPRIENSGLYPSIPPTPLRLKMWVSTAITVKGFPGGVFIKIYTHGAQEGVIRMLFDKGGLEELLSSLKACEPETSVHFLSAREMANIVLAIEDGATRYSAHMRDHRLKLAGTEEANFAIARR